MKGQGAMEYLMTYGWALLIVIVVGAALFSLGVLNPQTYTQKGCRGMKYFTYQDHRLSPTGFVVDVLNGKDNVAVTSVTVNGVPAVNILPTGNQAYSRFIISGDVVAGGQPGDTYLYDIQIEYNVLNGITNNQDRATCTGIIG